MNIRIKRLELTNFKCFAHKEISFNDDVTTIRGRNGVGKTTIADAILWTLFGKNSQGQADFDLKTHGDDGKPIPNLDHSVEMILDCDGREITLKRTLKETWVKKRSSEEMVFKNNTTEYMVNGEVKTASDYKKYISELVGEEIFRAITNPQYFPSLKWQQQRDFLSALAGDIRPEDISAGDVDLQSLSSELPDGIIAYRKHLSYQIKQIKDKLEKIPVRLEEQNKALPEKKDWDALQEELDKLNAELEEQNKQILAIKSGNGQDIKKEEIHKKLDELFTAKRELENNANTMQIDMTIKLNKQIMELSTKFGSLLNTQRDIETQINSFDTLNERCKATLEQCELDANEIRKQWADNLARTISFNDDDNICPTCGQYLPAEQVNEKREKAIRQLNESKANIKDKLTKQANEVKQTRAKAEEEINGLIKSKEEAEVNLANIKEQINTTFSEKQKLEKEKVAIPTTEQVLSDNEEYKKILSDIKDCKHELENVAVTSEEDEKKIESLNMGKALQIETIHNKSNEVASKYQYDKIMSLIDGIKQEQKDLVTQLSELERKEDIARRYQDRQNQILEERINQHFSLVQWKMFRTVNNGGDPFDEPFCECYVDGVAYHDGLNQAARLNAGLDIINTLCKHYQVSAPIVLDNAESTINIIQTIGQQIRLQVYDSDLSLV